jgi:magnesium-transporting ATPase (P-type)
VTPETWYCFKFLGTNWALVFCQGRWLCGRSISLLLMFWSWNILNIKLFLIVRKIIMSRSCSVVIKWQVLTLFIIKTITMSDFLSWDTTLLET